jgi:lipopolysaccharide/colanic/teichoic acid biosynthesis glycosyltransferase
VTDVAIPKPGTEAATALAPPPSAIRISGIDVDMEYIFNATCALALLLFFAPVMIVTAILVKMHDGGPVLFGHRRIGKGGRTFPCFKFRSMAVDADRRLLHLLETNPDARREWERDFKLQHDPRITPLGHFLRKSSLDELPQLLNVLRGEMSLVGPRPIVQAEVPRYGRRIAEYCSVRSGITGLWQISGRSDVDYRRRVAIDVTYVRAKSFLLDVKILVLTVPAVLLRRGAR